MFGEEAELAWGGVETDHPAVDTLVARATKARRVFVVLLNQRAEPTTVRVQADVGTITGGAANRWKTVQLRAGAETMSQASGDEIRPVELPAFGWSVLVYDY